MFWSKKNSNNNKTPAAKAKAEALANMKAARTNIGDDNLKRIAAAMAKKETADARQKKVKEKVTDQDAERVVRGLLDLIENS